MTAMEVGGYHGRVASSLVAKPIAVFRVDTT
jgi:hypothetical protein